MADVPTLDVPTDPPKVDDPLDPPAGLLIVIPPIGKLLRLPQLLHLIVESVKYVHEMMMSGKSCDQLTQPYSEAWTHVLQARSVHTGTSTSHG